MAIANELFFLLAELLINFALFVGASYLGAKLALRSYSEGETGEDIDHCTCEDPPGGEVTDVGLLCVRCGGSVSE